VLGQDAVVRGYFRSATEPLSSAADLRVVAVTALEVAAGMAYLHAKGVVHGVSGGLQGVHRRYNGN
jgi:hypothetical protein